VARSVLVTGGGGFVGQWMARALLARGDEVWSAGQGSRPRQPRILDEREWDAIRWIDADVRDDEKVRQSFAKSRPDLVVHLAGISFVPDAEGAPLAAYEVNVLGAVRLLSHAALALARGACNPTIVVVGSGTQYGAHPVEAMPLAETAEQRPVNAYGATKAAQEVAALQIGRTSGLRIICTRSFSHSGVGHAASFLIPSLVERVRDIRRSSGPFEIGNDAVRDYLHVSDAVSAYLALADRGTPNQVYNVSSGVGLRVHELAEMALAKAGVHAEIIPTPRLQRRDDVPVLIGSNDRIVRDTGWRPTRSVGDILDDLLGASTTT
jgi:GDP-4-dehydro-6-deoxy-D-mannose reductase